MVPMPYPLSNDVKMAWDVVIPASEFVTHMRTGVQAYELFFEWYAQVKTDTRWHPSNSKDMMDRLQAFEKTLREELIPPEISLTVDPIPEEPPQPSSIPPQDPIPSVCVHEPSIAPQDLDPSLQFHTPVPAHRSPRHLASPKAQVNKGKQKMSKTVVFSLP
ncbi:uncharacterized protein MELLADRAFT_112731 [Melampsora larici-populina 98AG31]|uniref:Uncharacterized protein n=1 Tax=Melampsora larici-populina (strain 98AG31 / pathotype 3-4-7) TaxID=747676 RepID=F4S7E8_MELLP|nr:uncharacterized protein MELLADRAFT_112731 [Melampsora larici-populina 98AG31]EGF99394.1 hypothetical protein MELLADRAFT_112731 [Melampsora larici-populina 98AG31]